MGMDNQLARGCTYARKGQVISLEIKDSIVHAKVQGSSPRPYVVTIGMPEWNKVRWQRMFEEISSQAMYSAQLLSGEMPPDIGDLVHKADLTLFPEKGKDLKTTCSCPDYANPCKHIAAVYYILAEQFDSDPFLIFAMRGMARDQVLEELNTRRSEDEPQSTPDSAFEIKPAQGRVPESLTVSGFYSFRTQLDEFRVYPGAEPPVKGVMMKRLSDSLFVVSKKNLSDLLSQVYEAGPAYVKRMIHGDDTRETDNH